MTTIKKLLLDIIKMLPDDLDDVENIPKDEVYLTGLYNPESKVLLTVQVTKPCKHMLDEFKAMAEGVGHQQNAPSTETVN